MCRLVLSLLEVAATRQELEEAIEESLDRMGDTEALAAYQAFGRGVLPVAAAFELLVEFGAIDPSGPAVTPLGRWAGGMLDEPTAAPAPLEPSGGVDHIYQLKVGLRRFRPPVWRRVLVPADTDLGGLHDIIQVLMCWDGDHLHSFTADGLRYADPFYGLDGCADEGDTTLAAVLARPGSSIAYLYDFGDCWDHTITLEKVLNREPGLTYPTCVGGRGDAPVEDWIPDASVPASIPFDRNLLNRHLRALSPTRPGPARG